MPMLMRDVEKIQVYIKVSQGKTQCICLHKGGKKCKNGSCSEFPNNGDGCLTDTVERNPWKGLSPYRNRYGK